MAGSYRIVVAEDHWPTRVALAEFLEEAGYVVVEAADGKQALEACLAVPPQLLITDLDMPKMRGEELIRRLRAVHPDVAVAVLTGEQPRDVGMRATALGAQCFFQKPINLDEVARCVRAVLAEPEPLLQGSAQR